MHLFVSPLEWNRLVPGARSHRGLARWAAWLSRYFPDALLDSIRAGGIGAAGDAVLSVPEIVQPAGDADAHTGRGADGRDAGIELAVFGALAAQKLR